MNLLAGISIEMVLQRTETNQWTNHRMHARRACARVQVEDHASRPRDPGRYVAMWQKTLSQIAQFFNAEGEKPEPAFLYVVNPSARLPFPSTVPGCQSLKYFYDICDGGYFGPMIRFIPVAELQTETQRWIEILREYDERGDVIVEGRHCVFANDSDGTPWIYDDQTGEVASFYWKGGDWCDPRFASFDDFMEDILSSKPDDPDWSTMLGVIVNQAT